MDYEAVRKRLQERGYLSSHVERFVLLPQFATGSSLPGALGSAVKAALVIGPLLGGLLAAVLAWSERPLERAIDLPLFWLYLLLPATIAVCALDLVTALVVTRLAGRRGVGWAAAVSGVVALVYVLALWWARAGDGPLVEDLLFVLVAVPVVVAIGHLAGLVSLAGIVRRTGDVPGPRPRRRGLVVGGALLAGAIAVAARALIVPAPAPRALVPFATTSAPERVVVIGIDGLDGELVEALGERGALSRLLAVLESGATYPLRRARRAEPAEVWTTIATGLPPAEHGVRGAGAERLPGVGTTLRGALPLWTVWRLVLPVRTVPASRGVRRAPALWEIASQHVGTAVVGWWATWPAPPDERGPQGARARYVVSDRVLPKLLADSPDDRDVAPRALYARLRASFPAEVARLREVFASRFVGVSPRFESWAWESFLIDAFACERLRELLDDDRVSVGFAYLPGLDILRQRIARLEEAASAPVMFDVLKVLELYASALDERLGPIIESSGQATVIVADPGRGPGLEGFVCVRGPRSRTSCIGPALSEIDLAPLVLRVMGFPASLEMPGQAPEACLEPPSRPLGTVASYGRLPLAERQSVTSESDPEILERLRSLGYLR